MKKTLSFLFFALLSMGLRASAPDTLRLLCIGNSFSVDAVEQNLHNIVDESGHVIIIGNLYIGGCSLERHWKNAQTNSVDYSYRKIDASGRRTVSLSSLCMGLADEPWDVVTFQQASHFSGLEETYEPYLGNLVKYVRDRVPRRAKFYMHQTWAYSLDATHTAYKNYNHSQGEMYKALCNAYSNAAKRHHMGVVPSGTAIQNTRISFNGDNANIDGYHLNHHFGRYVAALTFYEALFGESCLDIKYQPSVLDKDRAALARACAHQACLHPFKPSGVEIVSGLPDYEYYVSLSRKIPSYTLPDALTMRDGRKVTDSDMWYGQRRPELLDLFMTEMYGKAPGRPDNMTWTVREENRKALGGTAIRKQVRIELGRKRYLDVLIYLPKNVEGKAPVFMGLNFNGNYTIVDDPDVLKPEDDHVRAFGDFKPLERGSKTSRWPVKEILARGYGLVTCHYYDIDPDFDDGFVNGVHGLYYKKGQYYPAKDEWGSISAWAWGLSRIMDYVETDPDIDSQRVSTIGHSRLGKTALLAGVTDTRFAMAISNDSGCGGAALSRRNYGETVQSIVKGFPHWFCGNFFKYGENPDSLPFDQHELIALMAPRPVYVASAEGDEWADPAGELLSLQEARKVYDFLGLDSAVMTGYHIREGKHDLTLTDWLYYMDFADKNLKAKLK